MLFGLSRSTILALAAVLFAAAWTSLNASRAEATCGSHVTVVNSAAQADPEIPLPTKCSGPSCGQAPLPAAPVSVPASESSEQNPIALADTFRVVDEFCFDPILGPNNIRPLLPVSAQIFHPPRSNASY